MQRTERRLGGGSLAILTNPLGSVLLVDVHHLNGVGGVAILTDPLGSVLHVLDDVGQAVPPVLRSSPILSGPVCQPDVRHLP